MKVHFKAYTSARAAIAAIFASMSVLASPAAHAQTSSFVQTNIVSDGAVTAAQTDPNMLNPWGIALGKAFWIDGQGSGFALVDAATGAQQFTVKVPPAASAAKGTPTGVVINTDTTLFPITGGAANFIFATRDGSIAAWNITTNPNAVTMVNNSSNGGGYTGIAVDKNTTATYLLAANFNAGTIDVFDSNFKLAQLAGKFADPGIPAGFSPFSVHVLNGQVYIAYAQISSAKKQVVGAGLGYLDVFDLNGNLVKEAIQAGQLNAPWGVAIAPSGFGSFAGDLLVGNFGDGTINAFDPTSFAFKGSLQDSTGKTIANTGLWEIVFGSSTLGDPNTLYFAAGINGGKDGVFASIAVAPPPPAAADFTVMAAASSLSVNPTTPATDVLTLGSSNGFSGPVTLSCSGLPAGATCSFNPTPITLSSGGTATSTLTVTEAATTAMYAAPGSYFGGHTGMAMAFLSPFGLLAFAGFRRRTNLLRGAAMMVLLAGFAFGVTGCGGSNSSAASQATPPSTTNVSITVNATSGSITHTVPVAVAITN